MPDLLDVFHAMFEEDSAPMEKDARRARDRMRSAIYVDMYGYKKYAWESQDEPAPSHPSVVPDLPVDSGPSDAKMDHWSYLPPTPMNADDPLPFGKVLDAPLG